MVPVVRRVQFILDSAKCPGIISAGSEPRQLPRIARPSSRGREEAWRSGGRTARSGCIPHPCAEETPMKASIVRGMLAGLLTVLVGLPLSGQGKKDDPPKKDDP